MKKGTKLGLGIAGTIVAMIIVFIIIVGLGVWSTYNSFVSSREGMKAQVGQIKNVYQLRDRPYPQSC